MVLRTLEDIIFLFYYIMESESVDVLACARSPPDETNWILRVTDNDEAMLQSVVNWFTSKTFVKYAVKEVGDVAGNTHIHMMWQENNTVKSSVMQAFHKFFKKRYDKESHSCKQQREPDWNNYIYMSKGLRNSLPEVIYKAPYVTDEHVQHFHSVYWADKPVEKDKTINANTSEKKPSKKREPTFSEKLTKEIRADNLGRIFRYNMEDIDYLMTRVEKAYARMSKPLDEFIIKRQVLGQLNALGHGECDSLHYRNRKNCFPELFPMGQLIYET